MKSLARIVAKIGRFFIPKSCNQLDKLIAVAFQSYQRRLKSRMSPALLTALIVAEDRRFYSHGGVDAIAIVGALWRFVYVRRLAGASTIEQQMVRVLTQDRGRTLRRKFRETILACTLVNKYDKPDIAGMYLAAAYFGWEMNGIEQACRRLDLNLSQLSTRQAASIVARLKYPEPDKPSAARAALIARRTEHILMLLSMARMRDASEVSSDAAFLDT